MSHNSEELTDRRDTRIAALLACQTTATSRKSPASSAFTRLCGPLLDKVVLRLVFDLRTQLVFFADRPLETAHRGPTWVESAPPVTSCPLAMRKDHRPTGTLDYARHFGGGGREDRYKNETNPISHKPIAINELRFVLRAEGRISEGGYSDSWARVNSGIGHPPGHLGTLALLRRARAAKTGILLR